MVVVSALSFAAGSTSAVMSYQAGATPASVVTARILFTVLALFLYIRASGGETRLPPRERYISLLLGVIMAVQSYALVHAFAVMPVALAVLTFYLYPLMIGVGVHFNGSERITPGLAVALVGAFIGLVLALDVGTGGLNVLGAALATFSALAFALIAMVMQPMIARTGDSRPITLHMHYTAVIVLIMANLVLGEYPLPTGAVGWTAFAAAPVLYAIAITTLFIAFGLIGPVRSSLVMNLEPVASIVFGFLLLSQVLSPMQILGAAIVIAAITVPKLEAVRRAKKS